MISLIAAVDKNFAIGKAGTIPWHLPADFAYFKEKTMGHPVIMGYNTYLSIGRSLPGRTNIVLTDKEKIEGCEVVHSLDEALDLAQQCTRLDLVHMAGQKDDEVFVIGGASVYAQALPYADKLMVTYIDTKIEGADAFFPKINFNEWLEVSRKKHEADEKNNLAMEFVIYEKR